MSQDSLEQFLGRLITDDEFRESSKKSFARTWVEHGFILTKSEQMILQALDFEAFKPLSDALDGKVKRCGKTYRL